MNWHIPSMARQPRFTIVTVCFNAAATIAATAASLAKQRFTDFEWLVIDGASQDETLALVESSGIGNRHVVSERDHGIYDAMNKAIGLAKGEWVYFLNSGDAFVDGNVLADVAATIDASPDLELVWGDMLYVDAHRERRRTFQHVKRATLVYDDLNHQAVFALRTLFRQCGHFDLRFRTSADYDWLLRAFKAGAKSRHVARLIGRFAVGGMHSANPDALAAERRQLRLQYVSPLQLRIGTYVARWRRRYRLLRGHGG